MARLFDAIDFASRVVCDGYEMDTFDWKTADGKGGLDVKATAVEMACSDDPAFTFEDQDITLDEYGGAMAVTTTGELVMLSFDVFRPVTALDLEKIGA